MKIIVLSPRKLFRNDKLLKRLDDAGAKFYDSSHIDLGQVPELFDGDEKVLAIDELNVLGGFSALNSILPKLKNVKYICGLSARFNEFDIETAKKMGIDYCNNPSVTSQSVAEYSLALLMSVVRNFPLYGKPDFDFWGINHLGREIKGMKAGIIGYGNIGEKIAVICSSLGMEVLFWSRHKKDAIYRQVDIDEIMNQEAIFVAVPTTAETKDLLNNKVITNLKPKHYLIDITASDDLYEKNKVISLANNGLISGFGFEAELPSSSYVKIEGNVVVSPHVGWGTVESYYRLYEGWVDTTLAASESNPINRV